MKKLIENCKYPLAYSYYVTDSGEIWSDISKKFLSVQTDKDGYIKVRLVSNEGGIIKRHRYSVHRLVLENFNPIDGMENLQINHIDGNKRNNCLDNLEWVSCEENIRHAIENNLRAEINGAAKLTKEQVIEIFERANKGETNVSLSKEFGVHADTIGKIKNRKTWKNVLL